MLKFLSQIALCGTLALSASAAIAGPTGRLVIQAQTPVEHLLMRHFLSEVSGHHSGASTVQRGRNNRVGLRQNGRRNNAVVMQHGNRNSVNLGQRGNNNAIGVFQLGDDSHVRSRQRGNNNTRLVFVYPDYSAMSDAQIAARVIRYLH